ncbi:hypothetical protein HMPREF1986_01139 [Oribacterium sp. oral taxon 078 str. F0263]|nr:hypothetical protein HMPREF1986_01139 [Oribacterium sp. oral taxon 078 str. F0263]
MPYPRDKKRSLREGHPGKGRKIPPREGVPSLKTRKNEILSVGPFTFL